MTEKTFKLFLEVECEDTDDFNVYRRIDKALRDNGFNFRRGTVVEKDVQHIYMHGTGM